MIGEYQTNLRASSEYRDVHGVTIYMDEKAEMYKSLGSTILYCAIQDYTMILAGLMEENCTHNKKECEAFFRSPIYSMLTDISPEDMIRFCQKVASKIKLTHSIAKCSNGKWYAYEIGHEKVPLSYMYKDKYDAVKKAAKLNGLTTNIWEKLYNAYPDHHLNISEKEIIKIGA